MAYRNPDMIMPSVDDMVMWLLGVSEANYNGEWMVGWYQYQTCRLPNWPTAFTFLKHHKFTPHGTGWQVFIDTHIGVPIITPSARMHYADEQRWEQRLGSKTSRVQIRDEVYEALLSDGLSVCTQTYQRTGRMILR